MIQTTKRGILLGLIVGSLVLFLVLGGCSSKRTVADVTDFFRKGRIGSGPDVGLYKRSTFDNRSWDLMAVFFAMVDDFDMCQAAIAGLGTSDPQGVYDCRTLNE